MIWFRFISFCIFAIAVVAYILWTEGDQLHPTPEQWRQFLMHVSKMAPTVRRWPDWGIVNGAQAK